jgi:hypothetical protein
MPHGSQSIDEDDLATMAEVLRSNSQFAVLSCDDRRRWK